MYSAVAADDVILRADAFSRPEESAFPQRIADLKDKQILRCAQDGSLAFCYTATLRMVQTQTGNELSNRDQPIPPVPAFLDVTDQMGEFPAVAVLDEIHSEAASLFQNFPVAQQIRHAQRR